MPFPPLDEGFRCNAIARLVFLEIIRKISGKPQGFVSHDRALPLDNESLGCGMQEGECLIKDDFDSPGQMLQRGIGRDARGKLGLIKDKPENKNFGKIFPPKSS